MFITSQVDIAIGGTLESYSVLSKAYILGPVFRTVQL